MKSICHLIYHLVGFELSFIRCSFQAYLGGFEINFIRCIFQAYLGDFIFHAWSIFLLHLPSSIGTSLHSNFQPLTLCFEPLICHFASLFGVSRSNIYEQWGCFYAKTSLKSTQLSYLLSYPTSMSLYCPKSHRNILKLSW